MNKYCNVTRSSCFTKVLEIWRKQNLHVECNTIFPIQFTMHFNHNGHPYTTSSCQTSVQLQRQSLSNTPFLHYNYIFCEYFGLIISSARTLPRLPRNSIGFIIYSASTINLFFSGMLYSGARRILSRPLLQHIHTMDISELLLSLLFFVCLFYLSVWLCSRYG